MMKFAFVAIASAGSNFVLGGIDLLGFQNNFVGSCEMKNNKLRCTSYSSTSKRLGCKKMFGPDCATVSRQAQKMNLQDEYLVVLKGACILKFDKSESTWLLKCDETFLKRCPVQNAKCTTNEFNCRKGFEFNSFDDVPSYDAYTVTESLFNRGAYKMQMYFKGEVVKEFSDRNVCVKKLEKCYNKKGKARIDGARCFQFKTITNNVIERIVCRDDLVLNSALLLRRFGEDVPNFSNFKLATRSGFKIARFNVTTEDGNKVIFMDRNAVCQKRA